MKFDAFDTLMARAGIGGAHLETSACAECLADLAKAFGEIDTRLDRLTPHLPRPVRAAIEGESCFETFTATRKLKSLAAMVRGIADSAEPDVPCPYSNWQKVEAEAWRTSYAEGRKLIELSA